MIEIQQLLFECIQFVLIFCFLIIEFVRRSREISYIITPILLLALNIVVILKQMNQLNVFLFFLPIRFYENENRTENERFFLLICKMFHVILWCVWITLNNFLQGQPIILAVLLIILITQKKVDQKVKRNDTAFDDTLNIRTNSDSERLTEASSFLVSIIKLNSKFQLIMCNPKAQETLKIIDLKELLNTPVIAVDKKTKILLQEQFSSKFPSNLDFKEISQLFTLKEILEQVNHLEKYPHEFEIFNLKDYPNLLLKIFCFDSKTYTIIIQDMEEYNLVIKKYYTQTTMQQLFRSFSHEFNTSLNYILALAQVAECHDQVSAHIQQKFFQPILSNGRIMHSMVSDIIDYNSILAKSFSLEISNFSVTELMQEVICLFNDQIKNRNIEIKIQNNCSSDTILSDRNRIKQILINLVSNAQKFTGSGYIALRVETTAQTQLHQMQVSFHVEDTGIGMALEEQQRLQLLLSQGVPSMQRISKNTAGFGLGLFISNKIAEVLSQQRYDKGGGLRFETQQGKGFHCWFSVYHQHLNPNIKPNNPRSPLVVLNKRVIIDTRQTEVNSGVDQIDVTKMKCKFQHLLKNTEQQMRPRNPQNKIKVVQELIDAVSGDTISKECSLEDYENRVKYFKPKVQSGIFKSNQSLLECRCPNILIVDDEQINILALSMLLEQFGLSSDQVFNGQECVDLIYTLQKKTYCPKCSDKQYALIFMDINMPLLDGWEASKKIKKRFSPSIIACTAFTDNETKERCYQSGIDYYLSKPVKKESLIQVLQYYNIF